MNNRIITYDPESTKEALFKETLESVFAGDEDAFITHEQKITAEIEQELRKIAPKHPFYKWCLDNLLLFHYNPASACLVTSPHTTPINYHLTFREGDLSLLTSDDFKAVLWLKTDLIRKHYSWDF